MLLQIQLKKALQAVPEFQREIRAVIEDVRAKGGTPVTQIMNITRDHNTSYQISGSGNVINK